MFHVQCDRYRLAMSILAFLWLVSPASAQFAPDDSISIGLESNPVEIELDPNAPPWDKEINDPQGAPWADDLYDIQQGIDLSLLTVIQLDEWVKIGGVRPWTDWHEEILDGPGWVWDRGLLGLPGVSGPFLEVKPPGGSGFNPPSGLAINATDTTVDFFFDPLAPGTEVHIIKRLIFVGPDLQLNTGDIFQGPLVIREYPTPEPGALLLMMASGGWLLWRRRHLS